MAKTAVKAPPRGIALGQTALAMTATIEAVPIGVDGFAVTVNGLVVNGHPAYEEWEAAGNALRVQEKASPFALGDFLNLCEEALGEMAAQIVDYSSGWSERTCANYRWLAQRIPPERRRMDRLGIKHHQLVAALGPAQQRKWLEAAAADKEDEPWTAARLRAAIAEGEDKPPLAFWVLVACESAEDQTALLAKMEHQGRTAKAVMRRKPKKT